MASPGRHRRPCRATRRTRPCPSPLQRRAAARGDRLCHARRRAGRTRPRYPPSPTRGLGACPRRAHRLPSQAQSAGAWQCGLIIRRSLSLSQTHLRSQSADRSALRTDVSGMVGCDGCCLGEAVGEGSRAERDRASFECRRAATRGILGHKRPVRTRTLVSSAVHERVVLPGPLRTVSDPTLRSDRPLRHCPISVRIPRLLPQHSDHCRHRPRGYRGRGHRRGRRRHRHRRCCRCRRSPR